VTAAALVRPVGPGDDLGAIGHLVVEAYRTLPGYVREPAYELELADVATRVALAEVAVAELDRAVVGCVTFVPDAGNALAEFDDADAAGIRMLAVDPLARGAGIGATLVGWCLERARAAGRRRVLLHSAHYMPAAHRLYERLGFARDPDRDWTPVPGIALLGYRLEL
jgi:GNAT superfamily N-acetyltransferase